MSDLDDMLARLRARPADRDLATLEAEVWRRLDGGRAVASASWGLRAAAAAVAMSVGLAAGVTAAPARPGDPLAAFSAAPSLAPSTLLESLP